MSARSHGSAASAGRGAQAAATIRDFATKLAHRSARRRPALARIVSGIPNCPCSACDRAAERGRQLGPGGAAGKLRRAARESPAMYLRCRQTLRARLEIHDALPLGLIRLPARGDDVGDEPWRARVGPATFPYISVNGSRAEVA